MVQDRWISRLFWRTRTVRVLSGSAFRGFGWMLVVAGAASMLGLAAQGQTIASANDDAVSPEDIVTALHQMSDKAGVIFVGQVSEVRRLAKGNVAAGVVEIRFEVEQAVLGCNAGSYVLREWAGLWEGDNQRYRAGQRFLMLLHAPNAAGLSSPVDGMDGAIPIVRGGRAPVGANSSAGAAPPAVDLRWVGTKVLHPVRYASGTASADRSASRPAHAVAQGGTVQSLAVGSSGSVGSSGAAAGVSASNSPGSASGSGSAVVPAQQASVDVVVGMLTSWQKVEHAAY
jgi:hypothetical protein